jgi:dCMP deaminase
MDNQHDKVTALTRQDKNDYYLSLAKAFSHGSPCTPGKQHGCVAVKHGRLVSSGYNGPSVGQMHCGIDCPLDIHKMRTGVKRFDLCPAVHAEINCICTAAMIGTAIQGAIFYLTKRPCKDCLKALRNMSLGAVVFYSDDEMDHIILYGPSLSKEERLIYGKRKRKS